MGKRGRKSAAELATVKAGVEALPQRPEPPEDLDEASQERWREIVNEYAVGRFTETDLSLLADLVRTEALIRKCDADIEEYGQYIKSDRGNLGPHPAVLLRDRHVKTAVKLQQALRLNPSSRYEARSKDAKPQTKRKPWEK